MIQKRNLLYEGKAKKVFETDRADVVIQEFKDSLTAFNAQKKGSFEGKGQINLKITTWIFKFLNKKGIQTHFIDVLGVSDLVVHRLEMIPLEVVVRNTIAGSLAKRFGLDEGKTLAHPLVEFYFKRDDLNDPLITDDEITALQIATSDDVANLKKQALLINDALKEFFIQVGVDLVDFKIEFGKNKKGDILLADEISPDSCRLWDSKTQEKMDKDRFRRDLGKVQESYEELLKRIENKWSQL